MSSLNAMQRIAKIVAQYESGLMTHDEATDQIVAVLAYTN